jgi:hypothetical protein
MKPTRIVRLTFSGKNSLESMTSFYREKISESMHRQRSIYFKPIEILVTLKYISL